MRLRRTSRKRKGRKTPRVESVLLSKLKRGRRGKHHQLMQEVLGKLDKLEDHSALKIRLTDLPVKTLRSAVFRAASTRNIEIASFSDQKHLYVLRKTPPSPGSSSK